MITLTPTLLAAAMTGCPLSLAQLWAAPVQDAMARADISTPERAADFLAQVGHESLGLQFTRELWGPAQVPEQVTYERDPLQPWGPQLQRGQRNFKAYTLGNSEPGDGFRFRGGGGVQRTGRANYVRLRNNLRAQGIDCPDFEANPGMITQPQWSALSDADFWTTNLLNRFSDSGDFVSQTRAINGGANGLADRQARRIVARRALGLAA